MPLEHFNPTSLHTPPNHNYTQIVTSTGGKTIHVAGMTSFDAERNVDCEGDFAAQVKCTAENIARALPRSVRAPPISCA